MDGADTLHMHRLFAILVSRTIHVFIIIFCTSVYVLIITSYLYDPVSKSNAPRSGGNVSLYAHRSYVGGAQERAWREWIWIHT